MNAISQRLSDNAALVEAEMHKYLEVELRPYAVLIEAMKYSAYAGGKRIRPSLAIEFCRLFGGNIEAVMPYAGAVEMIHTYSLIHDDLPCMDNDDYRRGKLTNHKKFGEAVALLAGDALLTYAFAAAAGNKYASAEQNMTAVKLLAENAGFDGMIGGQMLDLIGENQRLDKENFLKMNRLKTGCLFKTACLLGCVAAGEYGDKEKRSSAIEYAENAGLAFQVEDDILDYGTEDNKTTFLSFMSLEEARDYVKTLTSKAVSAVSKYSGSEILSGIAEYLTTRTV